MKCTTEGIEFCLDVPVIMAAMRRVIAHEGHRGSDIPDLDSRYQYVSTEYRTIIEATKQVIELERLMLALEQKREEVKDAVQERGPAKVSLFSKARGSKKVRRAYPEG